MATIQELEQRLDDARRDAAAWKRQVRIGSWIRLGLFFAFVACWVVALVLESLEPGQYSVIPLVVFPVVVVFHERRRRLYRARCVERDLLRETIARRRSVRTKPVHRHAEIESPTHDLDAGRRAAEAETDADAYELGSFTQNDIDLSSGIANLRDAVDTTQTPFGFRRLSWRLRNPMRSASEIRRRQEAVRELADEPELRFRAARAMHALRERSLDHFTAFVREPLTVARSRAKEHLFLAWSVVPPASILGYLLFDVPGGVTLLTLVLSGLFILLPIKAVLGIRDRVYDIEAWVRAMERFAADQAAAEPKSEYLRELRATFCEGLEGPRDRQWSVLRRRIGFLHWGDYGLVSFIWNVITLWDLHFAARIERSLKTHADAMLAQASAFGEWEMLAAFAQYHEDRSDTVFPEIVESDAPVLEIEQGRHPYLEDDRVVANDLALGDSGNLLVLTGSNMAGKSTFLKMISLHVVLAEVGAPVRADAMRITPVRLVTVIDVEDDLVHGFSYFRVEVDRVKEVLELASHDRRILGVFDELFRGTNSTERVLAGKEILRHLAATGGLFLMATHDMEYTKLPDEVPSAKNIHFTEDVDEKGVHFTYRAKSGPATVRNALRVLEFCGIPSDIIERARAGLEG